ncbi:hypothetical protein [Streptomyces sp. NBC_01216]|uniref:hypothetical protein n=1 Tax=unclassified Streptomyces TaxID=2593676 RepID=UPI002E0DFA20|nr:hypothetical protein OG393_24390 [Streptomyces sp. NBC_01216]
MGHWFTRNFIEPGKLPTLLALVSFLLTFVITRTITRLIRAGKGPFRNVSSAGGLHIHHVVPGVVLTVLGGFGAVASDRHGAGAVLFAIVFGIGAGLVLDEFALILHLDDVYWSEQGRQSVEVVVLTAALVMLVLAGFSPLGVNDVSSDERQSRVTLIAGVLVNVLFILMSLVKGKFRIAVIGALVPFVAVVGAVRLARPGSWWSRHFYRRRHRARARSRLRTYRHDRRWNRVRRKVQDVIGGFQERVPTRDSGPRSGAGPGPEGG